MEHEQFKSELLYQLSLSIAKSMRKKELISEEEYEQIDAVLMEKYCPALSMLLAGRALTECSSEAEHHTAEGEQAYAENQQN